MSEPQLVWITGASSGIGAALARGLAARGCAVAASARRADRLEALAREAAAGPGRILARPLDVTDPAAARALVTGLERDLGPIRHAVLNAGDYTPMPARDFDADLFRRLVEVNYLGVVNGLAALLPAMLARGCGRILITASVAGYRGLPLAAPYGATKAALINLAESLRAELAGSGVLIRVINPGFVRTELTAKNTFAMPALLDPEAAARHILARWDDDRFEIAFPTRFVLAMKLLRCLPYRWFFPLLRKATES